MQVENPMILNILHFELDDDVNVCEACNSPQEDVFYVTDKCREFKGCKSCVSEIAAYDDEKCPVCGSKTCLSFYRTDGEGIFGCDDCVSVVDPINWHWEKAI